jgi:hypothetical protein
VALGARVWISTAPLVIRGELLSPGFTHAARDSGPYGEMPRERRRFDGWAGGRNRGLSLFSASIAAPVDPQFQYFTLFGTDVGCSTSASCYQLRLFW